MKTALRFAVLAVVFTVAMFAAAAEVPFLSGRITDNAEILSQTMRRSLTDLMKAHEDSTGNQIAVLTVTTLGGESIEEYATAVFDAWKLGQKGKDNGVLIIVAPSERRMRIEVGYGLEAKLTDLLAGRIIRNIMTPRFKAGDYDGGVEEGVKAVITALEGGEVPEAGAETGPVTQTSSG